MKAMKLAVLFVIFGFSIANADVVLVPDFRVDQDPTPNAIGGVASSLTYGYFVVAYTFTNPPTYIGQCYARRFDLNGNPLGNQFRVDSLPGTVSCNITDVAIDTNGNMIFTWPDDRSGSNHIYFRMFAPNETPLSPDTLVDQGTLANYDVKIAPLPGGGFIITWDDARSLGGSIYARIYDSSGSPVAGEFRVDQNPDANNTAGISAHPVVATGTTGQIHIAWTDGRNRGLTGNVYARLYNSSGTPLGNDFQVDQSPNRVIASSIAAIPNGNFIAVWNDYREEGDFGPSDGYGRVFDSIGSPITSDFKLLQSVAGDSSATPSVTSDLSGRFIVASPGFAACGGLCIRHFDSAGLPMDSAMQISTGITASPITVAVGSQSILTVFNSDRSGGPDIWANITGPENGPVPTATTYVLILLAFFLFCLVILKSRFRHKKIAIFIIIINLALFSGPVYALCTANPDFPPADEFSFTTLYGDFNNSSNRVDIFFIGDGFTTVQQEGYNAIVDRYVESMKTEPTYNAYFSFMNIHRINVNSPQAVQVSKLESKLEVIP